MQPEAKFKQALRRSFRKHHANGLWTHLVKGPGMLDGMPDLLVGDAGWHFYLEAKVDTLQVRPTQRRMFDRMAHASMDVIVLARIGGVRLRAYRWPCPDLNEAWYCPALDHDAFWQHLRNLSEIR